MKERIAQIMQNENMTAIQFAKKIGINPSSLSHILSGRNKTSLDIIMKIHKGCPGIDLNWLLYGEGEMNDAVSHQTEQNIDFNMGESGEFLSDGADFAENRKEIEPKLPQNGIKEIVKQEVKYIEKPSKKITEIRIFFDNGTYETFSPNKQ